MMIKFPSDPVWLVSFNKRGECQAITYLNRSIELAYNKELPIPLSLTGLELSQPVQRARRFLLFLGTMQAKKWISGTCTRP